ncbi:MAG: NAD(P)-dependent oxidoreductase [Planctomycetota bacterium]
MHDDRSALSGGGEFHTLPINLLLKGRLCLLVGAGHVAHRKLVSLLVYGGRAVLVAPEACAEVIDLVAAGRIVFRAGRYDPSVLTELEPFLVYAATDDDALNRRIVADAARLGILASSVSSWREGDFISPSVLRWGKGQVSITTEGASCRQAKFMRQRLGDLLGGERALLLVGADLRCLTLEELEKVRPAAAVVDGLIGMLKHLAALEEFVLLATCNRLELYAYTHRDAELLSALLRILGLETVCDKVYVLTGEEVVEHAANVVAGHLSQVIGETQITGQFKDAFQRAFAACVAGVQMQNLHDRALALGKKLRVMQGASRAGLPELVANVVRERLPVSGPEVLLLGAGNLSCEVAERLGRLPELRLTWANRTLERIPDHPKSQRLLLDRALEMLGRFDQVVSVVGAAQPIIRLEHLRGVERAPLLIDLGLPRNVAPEVASRDGVEVLDLGDFRADSFDRSQLLALARTVTHGRVVVAHD